MLEKLLEFYGLREQPFGVTPSSRYLLKTHTHREALASLWYAIVARRGFAALIGEPGTGKTTLLFQLLERLQEISARSVFLTQTQCDSGELLGFLLADLGRDPTGSDPVEMHKHLNEILAEQAHFGVPLVLLIDEAQDLTKEALETVRLLSNFETPAAKLMQIILSGQPALAYTLASAGLLQLRQRVPVVTRLSPLSREETNRYIDYRLAQAGYSGGALFTPQARVLIAAATRGIPRSINHVCFNALTAAYALGKKQVDGAVVGEVLSDAELSLGAPQPRPSKVPPRTAPALGEPRATRHAPGWKEIFRRLLILVVVAAGVAAALTGRYRFLFWRAGATSRAGAVVHASAASLPMTQAASPAASAPSPPSASVFPEANAIPPAAPPAPQGELQRSASRTGKHARRGGAAGATGELNLATDPAGLGVFLDGEYLGKSPVRLLVPEGRHFYRVVAPEGFMDAEGELEMKPLSVLIRKFTWPEGLAAVDTGSAASAGPRGTFHGTTRNEGKAGKEERAR